MKEFANVWRAWWMLWGLWMSMEVYTHPGADVLNLTLYATEELIDLSIVFALVGAVVWLCLKQPPLWWRDGERWL